MLARPPIFLFPTKPPPTQLLITVNDSPTPAVGEWRARAILLTISLLLSLATAEAALRILGIGAPLSREGSGGFTFFTHHPRLGWDLVPRRRGSIEDP